MPKGYIAARSSVCKIIVSSLYVSDILCHVVASWVDILNVFFFVGLFGIQWWAEAAQAGFGRLGSPDGSKPLIRNWTETSNKKGERSSEGWLNLKSCYTE